MSKVEDPTPLSKESTQHTVEWKEREIGGRSEGAEECSSVLWKGNDTQGLQRSVLYKGNTTQDLQRCHI